MRSKSYWVITCSMILAAPAFLYVWVAGDFSEVELKTAFIYGLCFPLILKKVGELALSDKIILGDEEPNFMDQLKVYLRISQ